MLLNVCGRANRWFTRYRYAAELVAHDPRRYLYDLNEVHRLCFSTLLPEQNVGQYRNGPVWVGNRAYTQRMPESEELPQLMDAFYDRVSWVVRGRHSLSECLELHALALYIHPYFDGNGRSTRLHHAAVCLASGGQWPLILFSKRAAYCRYIQAVERELFPRFCKRAIGW